MNKHRVTLLAYTPDALELLLFTRNTRLQMNPGGLNEVKAWPQERKDAELRHAMNTIQSSFEFLDYTFAIEGVTRALTHQLVRHRIGTSFAQQTQRALDMGDGFDYLTGPSIESNELLQDSYDETMHELGMDYHGLIALGADAQDARGILPTNILNNIVFKANLRSLHDMALKRLCVKTQGEFQNMFRDMKAAVVAVHPWTEPYIRVHCAIEGTCMFRDLPTASCPVKPHVYDPLRLMSYGDADTHLTDTALWTPDRIQRYFDEHDAVNLQPKIVRS